MKIDFVKKYMEIATLLVDTQLGFVCEVIFPVFGKLINKKFNK